MPAEPNIKAEKRTSNGSATKSKFSTLQSASGFPHMNTLSTRYNLPDQTPPAKNSHTTKPENTQSAAMFGEPTLQQIDSDIEFVPSLSAFLTSDSITHVLDRVVKAVKKGGVAEATHASGEAQASTDRVTSPAPKRKRQELRRPSTLQESKPLKGIVGATNAADEYKGCWKEFKFTINAIGDGFLHLKPLKPTSGKVEIAFDVVSQHLIINYNSDSLSTIWPTFKVPTKAIYEVVRTFEADRLVRIHFYDDHGKERTLEILMAMRDDCESLIQTLQAMIGRETVTGNFK